MKSLTRLLECLAFNREVFRGHYKLLAICNDDSRPGSVIHHRSSAAEVPSQFKGEGTTGCKAWHRREKNIIRVAKVRKKAEKDGHE